jgi:hypothetical protein
MPVAAEKGPPTRWWVPANLWSLLSFSWASPAVREANAHGELSQRDADAVLPDHDTALKLSTVFEDTYASVKVCSVTVEGDGSSAGQLQREHLTSSAPAPSVASSEYCIQLCVAKQAVL